MTSKLTGTAALVTGASGIGAATARQLTEHGASVALAAGTVWKRSPPRISNAGGTALAVEADITDRTQAEAAVQQTVERFGRLDTLVNNAGLKARPPERCAHQRKRRSQVSETRPVMRPGRGRPRGGIARAPAPPRSRRSRPLPGRRRPRRAG